MPNSIEAQGVTVEEAIQVALNQLGVTRDRVEIEILHHPRTGFLGIGARRAKVRATVREAFLADGEEYDMSSGEKIGRGGRRSRRSRRRRAGRGGEKREEGAQALAVRRPEQKDVARGREHRPALSEADRGQRRRGRGRGDDREATVRSEPTRPEQRPRGPGDTRPDRGPSATRTPPRAPAPRPVQAAEPLPVPADDTEKAPPRAIPGGRVEPELVSNEGTSGEASPQLGAATCEELRRRAEGAVTEILRRMGFEARVSSFYDAQDSEIVIKVESEAEGLLIGRRGQTLDALEHLINRIVFASESTAETRLAIDVGGYRERRRETLLELADRLKVRALTQGRRIQVSPMSPRDRRILQGALARDDSVRLRVLGSGFYRRVVILPVGLEETAPTLDVESEELPGAEPLDVEDNGA